MGTRGFRVVRLIDLLTFGGPAVLSAGLAVAAALTPGNAMIGVIIAGLAAFGFASVFAVLIARRFAFSRDIAYVTSHGLIVMKSEWTPIRALLEKETNRVIDLWQEGLGKKTDGTIPGCFVRDAIYGTVVRWAKAPFTLHIRPGFKWMGLTSGSGESVMIGRLDSLERSAFGHEIGHVILMGWLGDGSEETLRRYHDTYGTPY